MQLFDNIIDTRVLFHYKEVPKDVLITLDTYGNDVCPNLTAAILIFITLATSSASSREKLLETEAYQILPEQRDGKDRLDSLMSVESELLDKIDLNNVIDICAVKKARREAI